MHIGFHKTSFPLSCFYGDQECHHSPQSSSAVILEQLLISSWTGHLYLVSRWDEAEQCSWHDRRKWYHPEEPSHLRSEPTRISWSSESPNVRCCIQSGTNESSRSSGSPSWEKGSGVSGMKSSTWANSEHLQPRKPGLYQKLWSKQVEGGDPPPPPLCQQISPGMLSPI